MTRKFVCCFVVAILLSPLLAFAGGQDDGISQKAYTLWDIPWGTSKEEVPKVVLSKTSAKVDMLLAPYVYKIYADAGLELLGLNVDEVSLNCLNGSLKGALVFFEKNALMTGKVNFGDHGALVAVPWEVFSPFFQKCVEAYGQPTVLYANFGGQMLSIDREIDREVYYSVMHLALKYRSCLYVDFHNVSIEFCMGPAKQGLLTTSVAMEFWSESAPETQYDGTLEILSFEQ